MKGFATSAPERPQNGRGEKGGIRRRRCLQPSSAAPGFQDDGKEEAESAIRESSNSRSYHLVQTLFLTFPHSWTQSVSRTLEGILKGQERQTIKREEEEEEALCDTASVNCGTVFGVKLFREACPRSLFFLHSIPTIQYTYNKSNELFSYDEWCDGLFSYAIPTYIV